MSNAGNATAIEFICEFLDLRHIERALFLGPMNQDPEKFAALLRLAESWERAWRTRIDTSRAVEREQMKAGMSPIYFEFNSRLEKCEQQLTELRAAFTSEFERVFGVRP